MLNSTCLVQDGESSDSNKLRTYQIVLLSFDRIFPQDPNPDDIQPETGTISELDVSEPNDADDLDPLVERDQEVVGYQDANSEQEAKNLFLKGKKFSSESQFFLAAGEDAGICYRLIAIGDFEIFVE